MISAYMLIDGNNLTEARTFYNLEEVFGGIDDGEYTFFKSLNASLGLQVELSLQTTVDSVA